MDNSTYNQIMQTLEFEGGYANDKDDKGGETCFGITEKYYPNELKEILAIERHSERLTYAVAFYYTNFWCPIPSGLPIVVKSLYFDMSVNMGSRSAGKILQQAVNLLSDSNIAIDGIVGKDTIKQLKSYYPDRKHILVASIKIARACKYGEIIGNNPAQSKFRTGWLKRTLTQEV